MNFSNIPFQLIDWEAVPVTEHKGETGMSYWRTKQFGDLRIRLVEYSADYKADHWCEKGHVIFCVEGEMVSELSDGSEQVLRKNMSYVVSDGLSSHRTFTKDGATIFIVDGGFLKSK